MGREAEAIRTGQISFVRRGVEVARRRSREEAMDLKLFGFWENCSRIPPSERRQRKESGEVYV